MSCDIRITSNANPTHGSSQKGAIQDLLICRSSKKDFVQDDLSSSPSHRTDAVVPRDLRNMETLINVDAAIRAETNRSAACLILETMRDASNEIVDPESQPSPCKPFLQAAGNGRLT
jgi:hypothetical protein